MSDDFKQSVSEEFKRLKEENAKEPWLMRGAKPPIDALALIAAGLLAFIVYKAAAYFRH